MTRHGAHKPDGPASARQTAASAVYAAVRDDILNGVLAPGERLRIDALGSKYEVTINPVREALNRLAAQGWVDMEERRGFAVAAISPENWRDLVRSRCMVEGRALREAIANRSEAWENGIVVALHHLTRTPRFLPGDAAGVNPEWEPRHHAFHHALLTACNSPIVLEFCKDLRQRSDRYRHIAALAPQSRTYADEHKTIADAALDGDADTAEHLLVTHYRTTLRVIEDFLAEKAPS